MNVPDKQFPSSSVTLSMLISESVYKVVVGIERIIRWVTKAVLRPCLPSLGVCFGENRRPDLTNRRRFMYPTESLLFV